MRRFQLNIQAEVVERRVDNPVAPQRTTKTSEMIDRVQRPCLETECWRTSWSEARVISQNGF